MQKLLLTIFFCAICLFSARSQSPTHIVVKGETLYAISKQYHVSVESIEKANKAALGENFKLKIGQKLIIPAAKADAKTETKADKSSTKTDKPAATVVKKDKPEAPTKPNKPEPQAAAASSSEPNVHIVVKGETVYAIAKANGLTWKQIKDANHLSDDMKLKLGQKLILPTKNPDAMYKPVAKEAAPESKPAPKPEVAKTTEQGKDYLSPQPVIKKEEPAPKPKAETIPEVKAEPVETKPAPAPAPAKVEKTEKAKEPKGDENPFLPRPADAPKPAPKEALKNENVNSDDYAAVFSKYGESGKKKVVYRGISTFMQSDNPGNQFLALYNYADMGSILKVTNLMSKESIYVKVIGKVPATEAQKDVILKVSNDAASKLKVTEDKFLVEVTGFNVQ